MSKIKYVLRFKASFIVLLMLIITSALLVSKMTFLSKDLFDAASSKVDRMVIFKIIITIFVIWLIDRVVQISRSILQIHILKVIKVDLKNSMFKNILSLNLSDFYKRDSGDYISTFSNDINLLEGKYLYGIIGLFSDIVAIIVFGISFFALQRTIALSILIFSILAMIVPVAFSRYTNKRNMEYSQSIAKFMQKVKEYIIAFPTIRNYSVENRILEKFIKENFDAEEAKFEAEYALTFTNQVGSFFSWFIQFVCVGIGLSLVLSGQTTIGTVIAAFSFASSLGTPLQTIIYEINSIRSVKSIVEKVSNKLPTDIETSADDSVPLSSDIEYNNVTLSIDGKKIVDDFSFVFEKGKKYLIIGKNGSGKSSLFKLVLKIFDSYTGCITIGGSRIEKLSGKQINSLISYLHENVSFLSDTVKNNVALFRACTEIEMSDAITQTQLKVELDRDISDEGTNISSGEQRRIEIARSLLGSGQVLVFDEVVSTLDIETAFEIEKTALSFSDKTVIFISHNFSGKLIEQYDSILVMDNGKLVAQGSYSELLSKKNEYFMRICGIRGII